MNDKIDYNKELANRALNRIRNLARGNGAQKDAIQIIKNSYDFIQCQALTHIELSHEIITEKKKGQNTSGEPIEDVNAIPAMVQKISDEAIKNNDMRKFMSNLLLDRPDKGFAKHAETFDLTPLNKEYISPQICETCHGNGKSTCPSCHGNRVEQCNQCHGRTNINCIYCRGAGVIKGPDGKEKQCNRCFGKRQIKCPLCQARGTVPCRVCRGSGQNICATCGGSGGFTLITRVKFKMKTLFEIDRAALPHPVVKIIENNGSQLVQQGHITLMGEPVRREDGGLAIQYSLSFPYADLDIGVNGKPMKVHMFGYKYKMLKISNFLDQMIEKNYALLLRAANNEGNIGTHIQKASKTRMIGEGLFLTVTNSPKKAMLALKQKFPFGASNDLIKDIVLQSSKALVQISKKSHYKGMALGGIITAIMNAAYFIGPVRQILFNLIKDNNAVMVFDFALMVFGGFITMTLAKMMALSPIKTTLFPLMTDEQRKQFKPRNNNAQWPAFVLSAALFIIIVFASKLMGLTPPHWFPL